MKQLLNTLYILTQDAWLVRDGECIAVRINREVKLRVPLLTLSSVVLFGRVNCTHPLIALCASAGVPILYLTEHGRFVARVTGRVAGNVLLRQEQYRRGADEVASAALARAFIAAKIANSRNNLQRAQRDRPDTAAPELAAAEVALSSNLQAVLVGPPALDILRGLEGDAARRYYEVLPHLITTNRTGFPFSGRTRRPPLDSVNALLSFLYSMLAHDVASACEGVGLDPAVGFLHRIRPGRASLALDLMEELRPVIADRLALSLINLRQVQPAGFRQQESGAVMMDDDTRKAVISAYQKRKQDELLHPFLGERVPFGLIPHLQAQLLARYLRGDLDAYPPFIWK